MTIFRDLLEIVKDMLPFLKSAAEKAFEKLPKDKQQELIKVSQLTEIIKQAKGKPVDEVVKLVEQHTGINQQQLLEYILVYWKDKGYQVSDLPTAFAAIWADVENRTETGLKSLWSGMANLISAFVANIDWQMLLMGIGEYVYRTYVKGKIKI